MSSKKSLCYTIHDTTLHHTLYLYALAIITVSNNNQYKLLKSDGYIIIMPRIYKINLLLDNNIQMLYYIDSIVTHKFT